MKQRSSTVEIVRVTITVIAIALGLLLVFDNIPPQNLSVASPSETFGAVAIDVLIFVGLIGVVVLWQARRIRRTHRALGALIEAIVLIFVLFIGVMARLYHVISVNFPEAFNRPLDFFDSMYFSMTIFSTVGFGDIYPRTHLAQTLVILQMVLDLVLLGVVVRVLVDAAQDRARSVRAAKESSEQSGA